MNKDTAKRLVQETLQNSFDKERFTFFSKNLFNHIKETPQTIYRGNFIPDAYKPYIKTLDRIGKYEDPEKHKIDILVIHLKRKPSLERARTMQRNFIAWYLNGSRGGVLKDAALVAFVSPDKDDWRFSFVKMEYKLAETLKGNIKAKEQLTPARRYSFLVGKNETSHTAQSQFVPLLTKDEHDPTLKQIEEAFGIEKVTREFFEKYRELFLKLKESLDNIVKKDKKIKTDFEAKKVDTIDFAKKLLGQIVFLYFLQKKGWFGVARDADWGTGPKNFLRQLFDKETAKGKNFFNDSLELLFYEALAVERTDDFYGKFNCKIPFLNGGLFDPISNYDWIHTDILLPNELFSNTEKTKQGDTGTGILDVFDRYNFTVKEDEPLEKEVAVDPEVLGKVFENLLEIKDRKSKGTYYTPREIVHYMCQQSLINYLDSAVNTQTKPITPEKPRQDKFFGEPEHQQMSLHESTVTREDINSLILHGQSTLEHDKRVQNTGRETKDYSYRMPQAVRENAAAIDKALESIRICDPAVGSGAFLVGMMHEIVNARQVLSTYLNGSKNRTPYDFKRDAIQNCLYGVDIDPGAVEIAKLRLWLSLVVDEEEREKIKPLPNLDYKIVRGDSLLGVQRTLENWKDFAELERLKPLYFDEANARKKQDYKNQIDEMIGKITNGHTDFDFEVYFSEVFHEKSGFDAVIGNPPYGADLSKEEKKLFKTLFDDVHMRTPDTFNYFISKAFRILNNLGTLTYIVSNNLLFQHEYLKTREMFVKCKRLIKVLNLGEQVFECAIVPSCVFVVQNCTDKGTKFYFADLRKFHGRFDNQDLDELLKPYYYDDLLSTPGLVFGVDKKTVNLIEKVGKTSHKLGDIASQVACGISTGGDSIFRVPEEVVQTLSLESDILYKVLIGREINKFHYRDSNHYIIYTTKKTKLNSYPNTRKYLLPFRDKLSQRSECKEGILPWFSLNRQRTKSLFGGPKIIFRQTSDRIVAAYDDKGFFVLDSILVLRLEDSSILNYKYVLAILNSKLANYFYEKFSQEGGRVFAQVKPKNLRKLFVPKATKLQREPFVDIVDKILAVTKDDDYLENSAKQAKVAKYEKQIDQMVYKLYDLTDQEIAIVEGNDKIKR